MRMKTLCLFVLSLIHFIACGEGKKAPAPPPPEISVIETQARDVPLYMEFVGQTGGLKDIAIRARVEGFMEGFHFQESAEVSKGDLLYTLESQPFKEKVLIAFREVEDALAEIATYRQELAATERQQKAAKTANELSKQRYDKGVSSCLEVLDSERTLFNAELQLSELQQLYRNAYVNLYKALGGGWISKTEMEEASSKARTKPGYPENPSITMVE